MTSVPYDPGAARHANSIKRAAFYGRYSTAMQRPASLEDQKRSCAEFVEKEGWLLLEDHCYTDAAKSGSSTQGRDAFNALKAMLKFVPKPFNYVLFDDTSRCSRKPQDILDFVDLARFYGIGVRFVAQALDTTDPNFNMSLQLHALIDQQYNDRLALKIFAGQKGRVLNGFHCGSEAYGYRSVRVPDPNNPTGSRQAASLGSKLCIVDEEAEIVVRIFQCFSDGWSMQKIATELNSNGIPSSQVGKRGKGWIASAIKGMLRNEKYRGVYVWNATQQNEHPETGQLIKIDKPAHEVMRLNRPEIRIVSDDLWDAVAARLVHMQDKQVQREAGGYARATNRQYLFSGFLFCGECGEKLITNGLQGKARYRCDNARMHRGCSNRMSISESVVAARLTAILATELLIPEVYEDLVECVMVELNAALLREDKAARATELPKLEADLRNCASSLSKLMDLIEREPSDALLGRLRERERENAVLQDKIRMARGKQRITLTPELLRSLVLENVSALREVLQSNVSLARVLFSGHLVKMYLHVDPEDGEHVVNVLGELDLFSGSNALKQGVLLDGSGTRTVQQHTGVLNFATVFNATEAEPCLFFDALCEILASDPKLSNSHKNPGEWARLLQAHFGPRWDPTKKLGSGSIGRCFRVHAELLATKISTSKIKDSASPGHLYKLGLKEKPAGGIALAAQTCSSLGRCLSM